MFFSLERVAKVEAFAGAAVPCGRCAGAIEDGAECVRCPACGAASHQSAELPCFTYGPTCPNCAQPSDLDAGFSWSPGEVGA